MTMPKIGALIPIRLASERLPGKALKEICGKPVVHHLLDRAFAARHIVDRRNVVVCTTQDEEDDPLVGTVEGYGASVFRGSRDDIIKRFYDAMQAFNLDAVIQIDGDDPLSDPEYMDLAMARLLADPALDIVTCSGLPLGVATKSFTRAAMDKVYAHYQTHRNDTGFIYFFTKTDLCNQATVGPPGPQHVHETARLTLDYDVDLEVFRKIFEALYRPGEVFGLSDVVRFLNAHPEVNAINQGLDEAYWQRTREKAALEFRDESGATRRIRV
jgi:spore coat polysaccharide biosynthesis protein SpsF